MLVVHKLMEYLALTQRAKDVLNKCNKFFIHILTSPPFHVEEISPAITPDLRKHSRLPYLNLGQAAGPDPRVPSPVEASLGISYEAAPTKMAQTLRGCHLWRIQLLCLDREVVC